MPTPRQPPSLATTDDGTTLCLILVCNYSLAACWTKCASSEQSVAVGPFSQSTFGVQFTERSVALSPSLLLLLASVSHYHSTVTQPFSLLDSRLLR